MTNYIKERGAPSCQCVNAFASVRTDHGWDSPSPEDQTSKSWFSLPSL